MKTFFTKFNIALSDLLLTIIICSIKSDRIFHLPLETLNNLYFGIVFLVMFFLAWFISKKNKISYPQTCSLCFSASGNNFELAIIICIATFGLNLDQIFVNFSPLVEIPVLVLLVK